MPNDLADKGTDWRQQRGSLEQGCLHHPQILGLAAPGCLQKLGKQENRSGTVAQPETPALGRLRQKHLHLKINLGYTERSVLAQTSKYTQNSKEKSKASYLYLEQQQRAVQAVSICRERWYHNR